MCIRTALIIVCILVRASLSCDVRVFNPAVGKYYKEVILLAPTSRTVHVDDCRRACVLDQRCVAYQMFWINDTDGYCQTVGRSTSDFSAIQTNSSYTLFAACPQPMSFYEKTGYCYTLVNLMLSWDDAWNYCKTIHPDAHLMDIQSQEEMDIALTLNGASQSVWLGGRRFTSRVNDLVWVHTNTNISTSSYTKWHRKEPSNPRDSENPADCVKIKYYDWYDSSCGREYKFICEF